MTSSPFSSACFLQSVVQYCGLLIVEAAYCKLQRISCLFKIRSQCLWHLKTLQKFSNEQRAVIWLRAVHPLLFDQNQRRFLLAGSLSMRASVTRTSTGGELISILNLPLHNYIHITKFIFFNRDEQYNNLGDNMGLALKMLSTGCRPRLKNARA